jgi:transaldolase/glucose-6-phosphate isomerase
MLTAPDAKDLAVPGEDFTFGTLCRAQARGDFAALLGAGRRILRLELGPAGAEPMRALENALTGLAKDGSCRR